MAPKSESSEGIVLNYVNEQNRPVNSQLVADSLQKFNLKKAAVQKALDSLADSGKISFKEYGKQKIYIAKQDQFDIPNSEELNQMKEENAKLQEQLGEQKKATADVEAGSIYSNGIKVNTVPAMSNSLQFCGLTNSMGSTEMGSSGGGVDTGQLILQKGGVLGFGNGHFENWADSGTVADQSQQTENSTDTDGKNQFPGFHNGRLISNDSLDQCKGRTGDQKTLRRLAQNREAARKSRLRKRVYVQQLETSRQRLAQIEQDLKRRQQSSFVSPAFPGDQSHVMGGCVPTAFDMEYARWLDEHQRLMIELRSSVNSHIGDAELQLVIDGVMSHYDDLFRLKSSGAKLDVFHILSGMWKSSAERCFMWLGGFRSSDILKILSNQIEPLTEQQLVGICNLQQSSQQAEDALSQGMEALQQSLVEALSSNSLGPRNSGNVVDYMEQMAIALSRLASLENFLHQADLLRLQTLQQLQRILSTRQAARALLAINDYKSRLRALSSLWQARPKE